MTLVLSICLLILAVLGHGYFWTDIVNRMHAWAGPRKLIDVLTLFCFLVFLALPVAVWLDWGKAESLSDAGWLAPQRWGHAYALFCSFWGTYSLLFNGFRWYNTDNPRTLLNLEQTSVEPSNTICPDILSEGVPQFLASMPQNQVLRLTIDRKRLAIPRLDSRHEGLKLAHISDLHMTGKIGVEWYEFVAEQVNRLGADAIVVTGDIVENEECWPWLARSLGKLRAKCGVYFVLGNHDYYIDTNKTKQILCDQGLTCLSEQAVETKWNEAPVLLGGNEQPWGLHTTHSLAKARGASTQEFPLRLVLLHSPDQFGWACEQGSHLALAGHTHGGQLRFPLLGPIISPSRFGTRYASGVFRRGDTVMHVTRGIAGKTPLRWNCPPEIALLELVCG